MSEKEKFSLTFQCENCKKHFPISIDMAPNAIAHKKEFVVNGKSIFLTYYDCPECGKRHFVQIDDTKSMQDLVKIKQQFVAFAIARKKGKVITKKKSEKFKKARQDLSAHRINLMKEFTGKTIVDETGKEYELRFSVWA